MFELDLWIVLALLPVYFAAGFIDSVAGGGGLIAAPAFLLTGTSPDLVLGTNKLAACMGTASSLINYARSGLALWRMAVVGLPAALLGSFLGTRVILLFDSAYIGRLIVLLLPLGVAATLIPKKDRGRKELTRAGLYVFTPLVCLLIGFYDGFFGPGTGSFFILALHLATGVGLLQASATAKIFNLATNLGSLAVFIFYGKVLFALGLPLALANIAGNLLGSRMAIKIGAGFVRRVLSVSLSLLFFSLLWKFYLGA
ncbi:MAG: TSUP family transporter [Deltaproteobacteria bacterium]|jgi:uncharacterized membrane protein YfcA|nr:TSUP family transporter [Deltaproteobacteria bacterium]